MDFFSRRCLSIVSAVLFFALLSMILLFAGAAAAIAAPPASAGEADCCSAGPMGRGCSMRCCEADCQSACLTAADPAVDFRVETRSALLSGKQKCLPAASITRSIAGNEPSTGLEIPNFLLRPPQPRPALVF